MEYDSLSLNHIRTQLERDELERTQRGCRAAVLVPIVKGDDGYDVLLEVRSKTLRHQPGEVCLPGGLVESDETARQAAVRETCEELLVRPDQIEVIGDLGLVSGLGNFTVRAFVGTLEGYEGTFEAREVDSVLMVPLKWFCENEPTVYRCKLKAEMPDDYPWDLIPNGRDYPFRKQTRDTYFYFGTDPLIWGFTAHVLSLLADIVNGN